jgi:hypothetical protein
MNAAAEPRVAGGKDARVTLRDHPTQSAVPIDGWPAALFGVPFFAAGLWVILTALGVTRTFESAPAWLIAEVGFLFSSVGLFLLVHGLRGVMAKARLKGAIAQRPGQPWLYDFPWRHEGITYSALKTMLGRLLAALFWSGMLVIPFWMVLDGRRGAWIVLTFSVFFGLLGLIFWWRWAVMLTRLLRYGRSQLRYDSFPYVLGGTLRARLGAPRHIAGFDSLIVILRCVQEQYITTGTGEDRSSSVVCHELYKDGINFGREHLAALAGGEIPIEFRLPADQPSTSLSSTPPLYWEIEARGFTRLVNYQAYFLIPVYQSSA